MKEIKFSKNKTSHTFTTSSKHSIEAFAEDGKCYLKDFRGDTFGPFDGLYIETYIQGKYSIHFMARNGDEFTGILFNGNGVSEYCIADTRNWNDLTYIMETRQPKIEGARQIDIIDDHYFYRDKDGKYFAIPFSTAWKTLDKMTAQKIDMNKVPRFNSMIELYIYFAKHGVKFDGKRLFAYDGENIQRLADKTKSIFYKYTYETENRNVSLPELRLAILSAVFQNAHKALGDKLFGDPLPMSYNLSENFWTLNIKDFRGDVARLNRAQCIGVVPYEMFVEMIEKNIYKSKKEDIPRYDVRMHIGDLHLKFGLKGLDYVESPDKAIMRIHDKVHPKLFDEFSEQFPELQEKLKEEFIVRFKAVNGIPQRDRGFDVDEFYNNLID